MRQIIVIAVNTFREAVRNRIFTSLIIFSILMMLLTLAVSSASLNEEVRLMKDIGLFLTSTFSALICRPPPGRKCVKFIDDDIRQVEWGCECIAAWQH